MTKTDVMIAERSIINFLRFPSDKCIKQLTYDILSVFLNNVASLLVLPIPTLWVGVAPDCAVGENLLGPAVGQGDGVVRLGAGECLVFCEDLLFQVNCVAFFPEFVLSLFTLGVHITNEFVVQANLQLPFYPQSS